MIKNFLFSVTGNLLKHGSLVFLTAFYVRWPRPLERACASAWWGWGEADCLVSPGIMAALWKLSLSSHPAWGGVSEDPFCPDGHWPSVCHLQPTRTECPPSSSAWPPSGWSAQAMTSVWAGCARAVGTCLVVTSSHPGLPACSILQSVRLPITPTSLFNLELSY